MMKNKSPWSLLFVLTFLVVLAGCGGGGGGSSDDASAQNAQSESTGTMAVMLTDSPSDDYDHIWIEISRAELLPADGGEPVVIFDPDQPIKFDLLSLRPEDEQDGGALLTLADVPVGVYEKIRLDIAPNALSLDESHYVVVGETIVNGSTELTYMKLPSGKIDFNFRGDLLVSVGSAVVVTVDIDCDKSIHVAVGTQINFRPVVFVSVDVAAEFQLCPRVLHGTVGNLLLDDQQAVIGFDLIVPYSLITIPILLDADTSYIDADGISVDAGALKEGDWVHVRGLLQPDGVLASMVVAGDLDVFTGVITQPVEGNQFAMDLDFDLTRADRTIVLLDDPLILWACDVRYDIDNIRRGLRARVIGKPQSDGSIVAVAVLLRPYLYPSLLIGLE